MDISDRLKAIRENKKMSVYKLSRLSDVSETYIRKIENGKSMPSILILEKLTKPLSITVAELLSDDLEAIYPSEFEAALLNSVRGLSIEKASLLLELAKVMNT